jgi:putative transposase
MEEKIREQAVSLHRQGHSVAEIARQLGKSRQWVYKWIGRSSSGEPDWNRSHSNAPHTVANRTAEHIEKAVVIARMNLENDPYREAGAYPIMHELMRQGIKSPSVATINRILKRKGLISPKQHYVKSGIDYPEEPFNMHIMDLVGPRYLRGGNRFYLLNIISNETRHAGVFPILTKSASDITSSVAAFWKSYSIPDFLQLDNELSFKGSNRHPRGLGLLLRTVLSLNVTPRFIPVGEPWRNGVIERFNQKVEKTLLTQEHRSFNELLCHSETFVKVHNSEHHYSTMSQRTPAEMDLVLDMPIRPLDKGYEVKGRPPIDSDNVNEISFIRLVRSDCLINVLNTEIKVEASLMHTYVEARVCINDHKLRIYQDGVLKQMEEFVMPVI